MTLVTWKFKGHLENRHDLAVRCMALAITRGKTKSIERFEDHAARYWREMNDEFNSTYSAWAD